MYLTVSSLDKFLILAETSTEKNDERRGEGEDLYSRLVIWIMFGSSPIKLLTLPSSQLPMSPYDNVLTNKSSNKYFLIIGLNIHNLINI